MNCLEVKEVTKNFGTTCALHNLSIQFEENKIYGLLGRNGAGKSTLLNVISNRIFPNSGQIFIDGDPAQENDAALNKLYLMSEKTYYPEGMKIKDAFQFSGMFYKEFDLEYALKLAENFTLNPKKTVKSLSTGYTSIFKLIIALSVNTPYLFFDEPVLGLDANHRELFYRLLIEKYSKNPCTIVISTHLIDEISNMIEEIVIIKEGSIIKQESQEKLLASGYTVSGTVSMVDAFTKGKNVIGVDSLGGLKTAYILDHVPKEIPNGIEITKLDLQKLFVQLTN